MKMLGSDLPTAGSGYAADGRTQLLCSRILGAEATWPRSFCWPVIKYGGSTKETWDFFGL